MVNTTRRHGTLMGLDHIGIGVSDMTASLAFYAELGFTDVAFDYTGSLPGLTAVTGHGGTEARVVFLRTHNPTVLGRASIKLVQITDRTPPPAPEGQAWGEPGICEVCVHVNHQSDFYRELVARGHAGLMEPNEADLPPYQTHCGLSYVADPDGAKIELIEWSTLEAGWPVEPGPQGVNHVAFGVADIERTRDFYQGLGFTGQLFESEGYFEPMHPWFHPRTPPRQRMMLLTSPFGGALEPVQHFPPSPDMRGEWGHLGTFEFAVGARCLDSALEHLAASGIALVGEPVTIDLGGGATWRYAYFQDPDDLYVCVTEVRA
ncbi:VOC family protein [Actinomadura scrupuli]|uniref:VOC family protein n=1 Tax=Actinomadura scrupuli TaxID=559629 RepID=UPI003D98C4D3